MYTLCYDLGEIHIGFVSEIEITIFFFTYVGKFADDDNRTINLFLKFSLLNEK